MIKNKAMTGKDKAAGTAEHQSLNFDKKSFKSQVYTNPFFALFALKMSII